MAGELLAALNQLKTDVAAISGVQRTQLGQAVDALPEATMDECVAFVSLRSGGPENEALTSTTERHLVHLRFYWLLIPSTVETVERSVATMWDLIMTKFFGSDADRNLTETSTIALVGGELGDLGYEALFERIGNKLHRVLIVPIEIILNTHSV